MPLPAPQMPTADPALVKLTAANAVECAKCERLVLATESVKRWLALGHKILCSECEP